MTSTLDPRFAAEIAAMAGAGWIAREVGRERAERFARASGFTFAEAMREIGKGVPTAPGPAVERGSLAPLETTHLRSSEPEPIVSAHLSTGALPASDVVICGQSRVRFASLPADIAGAISAALAATPSRTDRDIARELRCSPTTVGRARAGAGLVREVRTVRRRGASYAMRLPAAATIADA